MEKSCTMCGATKPIGEFYKMASMKDGHLKQCKECIKQRSKNRYVSLSTNPSHIESERARGREKYHRLYKNGVNPDPARKKIASDTYRSKYPEKAKARSMSQRMNCKEGHHLHHWSYNTIHGRDVIELPSKEHAKAHRFLVYDQERMMYRALDGVLLDTRERHERYILHMIKIMED